MNPKIYLTLFLSFFALLLFGQRNDECGTTINEQASTVAFVQKQRANPSPQMRNNVLHEIPIKIHVFGAASGAFALDSLLIAAELDIVNDLYAGANIEFVQCGNINYIFDNDYITFIKYDDEDICDVHDDPAAINIYFAPDVERNDGTAICGYAYNMDNRPRVFMDNACATNGSTLAHELGHSLSLLHTHSTSQGEELVSGGNCSIAGDLLCDTPADPRLSSSTVSSNCEYTGTELDNQQNPYMPDTENVMSYSRKFCRIKFSPQQLIQMEDFYLSEGTFLECSDLPPLATHDHDLQNAIEVFPNPATTSIFVKNVPEDSRVQLFDGVGKLLWEKQNTMGNGNLEINALENFGNGVYVLKVISGEQFSTHKILKM